MNYLVCKEFNEDGIWGRFNLAKNTVVEVKELNGANCLYTLDGKPICYVGSQKAFDYFARNNDGQANQRFELTHKIIETLKQYKEEYAKQVAKIQNNFMLPPEEREQRVNELVNYGQEAFELLQEDVVTSKLLTDGFWKYDFYNANISDLKLAMALIESVKE